MFAAATERLVRRIAIGVLGDDVEAEFSPDGKFVVVSGHFHDQLGEFAAVGSGLRRPLW